MVFKKELLPNALYIHIPFCARKCSYCDFNSFVSESKTIDLYLHAIEKELCSLKDKYVFKTVFIGGGTPSVLTETQLEKLLSAIIRYIPISEVQEYTVEANPGTLTEDKVRVLKECLVNRISLGVQSFQDKQLKFLGRIHSGADAKNTFALLRKTGFKNINIDLIFGCPEQSRDDWKSDLETAIGLCPEHISAYALTYEEGTLLTKDLRNGVINKLDELVELEMYKTTIDYLTHNGYNHYEISNFAKYGRECLHNLVYWNNMSYIGVGAGAYSFINGVRTSNEKDVIKYVNKVNNGENIKSFDEHLPQDQFASETVVMALRLRQGISNADFYKRFGIKIEDQFGEQINRLRGDGLIAYDNEMLKLTEKGLFIADTVMAEFL